MEFKLYTCIGCFTDGDRTTKKANAAGDTAQAKLLGQLSNRQQTPSAAGDTKSAKKRKSETMTETPQKVMKDVKGKRTGRYKDHTM